MPSEHRPSQNVSMLAEWASNSVTYAIFLGVVVASAVALASPLALSLWHRWTSILNAL